MTIDDLEVGYLVEFREVGYGIIANGEVDGKSIIYQDCSYNSINGWNKDLTDKDSALFDIVKVYKPKKEPSLTLSLDGYELLWERDNHNTLATEACEKIEEVYRCAAKFEAIVDSGYIFTFNFGAFAFSIVVCMVNISTVYELLHILYSNIDKEILSHFKY